MMAIALRMERDFYRGKVEEVAQKLLNKVLVFGDYKGRIVEVEAYGETGTDPASHTFKGRTPRNSVMFGPPGHLYVYFTYGMHYCANVVSGDEGVGSGVLLRALEPIAGVELMRQSRKLLADCNQKRHRDTNLASGPAKLCQALGIDLRLNGADLVSGNMGIFLLDDGTPPGPLSNSARIGISLGRELLWRWWVPQNPHVSIVRKNPRLSADKKKKKKDSSMDPLSL